MMRAQLKRKLIVALALPAMGLASAALAAGNTYHDKATHAAAEGAAVTSPATAIAQRSMHDERASKLIGMNVRNAQGENLGEINDLVLDVNHERVYYAILGFGGALGLGEKLFAYPVSLFSHDTADNKLVLNVDKEKLKKAPGFERANWPDWNRDRYRRDVESYFGPTVAAKPMANQHLVRASKLIGKDVNDRNGKDVGEIEDIVVNLGNGRIHYAVLDFDKAWSTDDKLLPVAMKSIQFPADPKKDLVLTLNRNQLDMKRGFTENEWPDVADPAYQRNVDAYLGRRGVAGQPGPVMSD